MKVVIWANSPSPHQADFYAALRLKVDLRVQYFGHIRAARRDSGWKQPIEPPAGEQFVANRQAPFADLPDWRERVHVIPGYSSRSNWALAGQLTQTCVPWAHWSENSQPSWRSPLTWPIKQAWAHTVNRGALGAFAQGVTAEADFRRWGIRPELISHLFYAVNGTAPEGPIDEPTNRFVAGRLAFIYVGSVNHNKATRLLIRAFADATKSNRQTCLVIVGSGPDRKYCERLAMQLNVADRVLFRGVVPHESIGNFFRSAHIAVLPSRYDGWGVVLNEAASARLALVASDRVGAAYHLIIPGVNGFRVRAGVTESLASALSEYARIPRLAEQHGLNSLKLFMDFTPKRNVGRFVGTVDRWLAEQPKWAAWNARYGKSTGAHFAA